MGIFGWSLPPGCGNLPGEEDEPALDLMEPGKDTRTIKGYGKRGHGLNGKDADLDTCGQITVEAAWWHPDGTVEANGRRYATVSPDDEWTGAQHDVATECVVGTNIAGEWTGEDWSLAESWSVKFQHEWDDDKSDEDNMDDALGALYDAINKDAARFESEVAALHACFLQIANPSEE